MVDIDQQDKKSIAVIGSDEFTLGFRLAGVQKVFGTENFREKIQELVKRDDLGIVIAEQGKVEDLPERIRQDVDGAVDPVVVALSEEATSSRLNEKIQRVIGVDLSG